MLRSKFVKSLISILKRQVNSPSNFALFFIVRLITPLWILNSYSFNFGLNDLNKIPILRLSSALVKICYLPHVISQITSQLKEMLDKSVNNVLYKGMQFLDKCSPLNFNFLNFPLLVWNFSNSSLIFEFWSQFCINFAPFCNINVKLS